MRRAAGKPQAYPGLRADRWPGGTGRHYAWLADLRRALSDARQAMLRRRAGRPCTSMPLPAAPAVCRVPSHRIPRVPDAPSGCAIPRPRAPERRPPAPQRSAGCSRKWFLQRAACHMPAHRRCAGLFVGGSGKDSRQAAGHIEDALSASLGPCAATRLAGMPPPGGRPRAVLRRLTVRAVLAVSAISQGEIVLPGPITTARITAQGIRLVLAALVWDRNTDEGQGVTEPKCHSAPLLLYPPVSQLMREFRVPCDINRARR